MRTTKALLPLAVLLALPGVAGAGNCYSIYNAKNQLAFQSTVAPIDLSGRISQTMRDSFPGGYLIIVPDDSSCREFRTGPTVSPRFENGKATDTSREQVFEAPLLRGAAPAFSSDGGGTASRKR